MTESLFGQSTDYLTSGIGGENGKSPALVKTGQLLSWSSYTMHRGEAIYSGYAAEFRPERWLDDIDGKGEKELRVSWEYLPFNGGPGICIEPKSSSDPLQLMRQHLHITHGVIKAFGITAIGQAATD